MSYPLNNATVFTISVICGIIAYFMGMAVYTFFMDHLKKKETKM